MQNAKCKIILGRYREFNEIKESEELYTIAKFIKFL